MVALFNLTFVAVAFAWEKRRRKKKREKKEKKTTRFYNDVVDDILVRETFSAF